MSVTPLGIDSGTCFIGGAWVAPEDGAGIVLHNPSDGSELWPHCAGRGGGH